MAADPRLDPNDPRYDPQAFARAFLQGMPQDTPAPADAVPVGFDGANITQAPSAPQGAQALAQQFVNDPSTPLPQPVGSAPQEQQPMPEGEMVDLGSLGASYQQAPMRGASGGARVVQAQGPTQTTQQIAGPEETAAFEERMKILESQAADAEEMALRQHEADKEKARVEMQRAQIAADAVEVEKARQAERNRAVEAEENKLREIQEDILGTEIDPNRAWSRLDTGSKIVTGLGVLLGGIGSGFGGSNPGLDIVQRALDRDLEAQKMALDKKVTAGKFQESIWSKVRERFNDDDQATLAARILQYEALDKQIAAAQARALPDQQMVLRKTRDTFKELEAQARQNFFESQRATVTSTTRPVVVGGDGGAAAPGTKDARMQRPDGGVPGFRVDDPDAFAQVAQDDVSYRQLRGTVGGALSLQEAVGRMKTLRKQHGIELFEGGASAEYDAARGSLIGAINQLREAGVVNDAEYERLNKEIPGLGPKFNDLAVWTDVTLNKIAGIERSLMAQSNAKLRSWGGSLGGTERGPNRSSDERMRAQQVVR